MPESPNFLFTTCQPGVEWALKEELARHHPGFRFAYSRPGFVTFKIEGEPPAPDAQLQSIFARTHGLTLGKVTGEDQVQMTKETWKIAEGLAFSQLHVWQREELAPGEKGFEPGQSERAAEVGQLLLANAPESIQARLPQLNHFAPPGAIVLDVILAEPNLWWIGWHLANSIPSRWPGAVPLITRPPEMISRAYLKIAEALLWSRLPISANDRIVELGSAPGGSCQALLDRGFVVTGIDPAEMHPSLLANPKFTHIRKRGADLKRREYRHFKWLTADLNVAPTYTLDTVEGIVTHADVNIQGMLLTLKMLDRNVFRHIDEYLARIRAWGFDDLRARQLAHNRQEICVAAIKK